MPEPAHHHDDLGAPAAASPAAGSPTAASPTGEALDLDPVWRALSDPTRRAILDELRTGPENTMALCRRFDHLSRHAVMKHLKILERANLVWVEVRGRERINHLNVAPIEAIYRRWMRPFEAYWASHLNRLADEVARRPAERGEPS